MTDRQEPTALNGAQISQLQKAASEAMQSAVNALNLRRECLQMAAAVCQQQPKEVLPLARMMHDFVTQPVLELQVKFQAE